MLCWHLLTKKADYLWARPALVAAKVRGLELQAGQPQKKGNRRGPAYAYNVKELREQEMEIARRAEAHLRALGRAMAAQGPEEGARAPQTGKAVVRGCPAALPANALLFATRSPAQEKE